MKVHVSVNENHNLNTMAKIIGSLTAYGDAGADHGLEAAK
jgi:hypothetical protein